jgi:hypothetical protein
MNWRFRLADWLSGGLITYWHQVAMKRGDALWDVRRTDNLGRAKDIATYAIATSHREVKGK